MNSIQKTKRPSLHKLTLTTIRYLGQFGEILLLGSGNGQPNGHAVKIAGKCLNRIEHIAQYALDGSGEGFQVKCLTGDLAFMNVLVKEFEGAFRAGLLMAFPSEEMLADLTSSIAALASRIPEEATKQGAWYWVRYDGLDGWIDWTPAQRQGNHWNSVGFRGIPMHEVEVGEELNYANKSMREIG